MFHDLTVGKEMKGNDRMQLKRKQKIFCVIAALFTVLAFTTANQVITDEAALEVMNTDSTFTIFLVKFALNYEKAYGVNSSIIFILFIYFYAQMGKKKDYHKKRLHKITLVGGLIFGLFMVFGNSFLHTNSWDLIFGGKFQLFISTINYIGYVLLFKHLLAFLIIKMKDIAEKQEPKEKMNRKSHTVFHKIKEMEKVHPILFYMVAFLICWLPYMIIFYPGTMNMDSLVEIEQYLGESKWTTHFPIFPTIIFGTFMKIGSFYLSNDNLGIFLNNMVQILLGSLLLSYCMNYIYQLTQNKKIRYGLFVFFAFFPLWPINFYTEVKDVYFSMAMLLYVIFSMKFIDKRGKLNRKEWMIYCLSMIFVYLFRNNGVFIVLFTFPFLVIGVKKVEKVKIIAFSILAIIFCFSFTKIYTQVNHITKGSIKEALSVPLQQTARYVMEYELTQEEEETISKLVEINDIKENYKPKTVDYVKLKYKKETATNENLKEYFKIWLKMLVKHPAVYFEATMNSTYGYYYPDEKENKDDFAQFIIYAPELFNVSHFNLHLVHEDATNQITQAIHTLRNTPLIGLLFSCGFYTWSVIFITLLLWYSKRKKEIAILIPLYTIILVCTASPVNAFVRYMMPVMLILPFVIGWSTYCIKNEGE